VPPGRVKSRRSQAGQFSALLDTISDVCQKAGIGLTLFYQWQKKLFEEGAVVFESKAANGRQEAAEARKLQALEARVQQKNEVLAELMGEHMALKKKLGVI
jgi:transposase-like protein